MRRWSIVAIACLIAPARVPASLTEAPRLAAV
jgi:hypothetical protein